MTAKIVDVYSSRQCASKLVVTLYRNVPINITVMRMILSTYYPLGVMSASQNFFSTSRSVLFEDWSYNYCRNSVLEGERTQAYDHPRGSPQIILKYAGIT